MKPLEALKGIVLAGEIRRLIDQGAVRLNDKPLTQLELARELLPGDEIRVGNRLHVSVRETGLSICSPYLADWLKRNPNWKRFIHP